MSIQSEFMAYLKGETTITDLTGTRIYPMVAPALAKGTDHLVLHFISDPRIHTHDGDCGLAHPRVQVTCWSLLYLSAIAIAAAVKAFVNSTTGTVGSTTGCAFQMVDSGDMLNPDPQDEAATVYGIRQDYILWHQE